MRTRLILVEGLPGSGKTTTAETIRRLVEEGEPETDVRLYEEGRTDHPADYEGFAYLTDSEWRELEAALPGWTRQLKAEEKRESLIEDGGTLLAYRSIRERTGRDLPEPALRAIEGRDVYELPLGLHIELIAAAWNRFAKQASASASRGGGSVAYIFECCFIQNPVTMAMIRCGAEPETAIGYVKRLEEAVRELNPLVVYADQRDVGKTFRRAAEERPGEWSDGFMDYYLNQGWGAANVKLPADGEAAGSSRESAIAGTIEVLRARRRLEEEILGRLEIRTEKFDNSAYDEEERTAALRRMLRN
ncbi:P-loop NTPase family protein [Saccharibacillus alkalitolerans]|uniref:Thymidylate kinase n=1 Tax=Saccharibacillus alkalitolerans TaxID=2705290 RepID=A0ABX0F446_9BACL|nr:hypothetical protein [Saccharibacillus alkalitolerans]NGZ75205.1 hypothetical protein [Saccharibacillus alkalitolerans]